MFNFGHDLAPTIFKGSRIQLKGRLFLIVLKSRKSVKRLRFQAIV